MDTKDLLKKWKKEEEEEDLLCYTRISVTGCDDKCLRAAFGNEEGAATLDFHYLHAQY